LELFLKGNISAGHLWLTPVILATQEDRGSRAARANGIQDPISKKSITNRAGGVAQAVENCKVFSSNSSIAKKKKGTISANSQDILFQF
jgi:hypothetical protein